MPPLKDTTILVVDDEAPVRLLLRSVLEGAGAVVLEADNGTAAVRLLRARELEGGTPGVSALVSDLTMPGMDGEALARWSHARYGHALPVVIVSGIAALHGNPLVAEGIAHAALSKPFAPARFIDAVDRAIIAAASIHDQSLGTDAATSGGGTMHAGVHHAPRYAATS